MKFLEATRYRPAYKVAYPGELTPTLIAHPYEYSAKVLHDNGEYETLDCEWGLGQDMEGMYILLHTREPLRIRLSRRVRLETHYNYFRVSTRPNRL